MKGIVDFTIFQDDTVAIVTPLTDEAITFVTTNIKVEEWQRVGDGFVVEHRLINDFITALQEDGFTVEEI